MADRQSIKAHINAALFAARKAGEAPSGSKAAWEREATLSRDLAYRELDVLCDYYKETL